MLKIPKKTCGQVLWQADGVSLQFKRCLVADGYWRGGAHVGRPTKKCVREFRFEALLPII